MLDILALRHFAEVDTFNDHVLIDFVDATENILFQLTRQINRIEILNLNQEINDQ